MARKLINLLALLSFILINGCSFNMFLFPEQTPLKEKVIEGSGAPKILLLDISGFISERERPRGFKITSSPSMVEQIREALLKAETDKELVGVILKVNSPGGTVTATDIIYHEIKGFGERRKVPVYAVITGIGASGGYYVSVAADRVFAHPAAITGSIGVIALKFNIQGLLGKIGVEEETYKSGDKKDLMSPFRPSTPEEREIVQKIIDSLHGRFLDAVHAGRKNLITMEGLKTLADGRVYTADQALRAKLIDDVGYLEDSIKSMKEEVGIPEARIVTYHRAGEYKGSIYSSYPSGGSLLEGLVKDGGGGFAPLAGVEFMYLWMP